MQNFIMVPISEMSNFPSLQFILNSYLKNHNYSYVHNLRLLPAFIMYIYFNVFFFILMVMSFIVSNRCTNHHQELLTVH